MCPEFKDLASIVGDEKIKEEIAKLEGKSSKKKSSGEKSSGGKALLQGSIISEKYKVIKVITDKENRATYLVKDIKITDKKFILREIIPVSMPHSELKERREKFREIVRILHTFKHKNLAEVYVGFMENNRTYCVMEYVEGLDLERLSEMSTTTFPPEKVVEWGLELCDAIEFMHYRPKPFTLGDFTPETIVVDGEGVLNVINYDLQRFFDVDRTLEFMPDNPEKLYEDITKLSQVLYFLMTKEEYDENALDPQALREMLPKMRKLLQVTCNPNQKSIGSIKEFKARLEGTLAPDKEEEVKRKGIVFPKIDIRPDFTFAYEWMSAFLNQKSYMVAFEVIFVLFIVLMGVFHVIQSVYVAPQGELAFVAGQNELFTIRAEFFEMHNEKKLDYEPVDVLPMVLSLPKDKKAGKKSKKVMKEVLLISAKGGNRIRILEISSNNEIGLIRTDNDPGLMITDEEKKRLFVLHKNKSNVSVINIKNMRMERVFPTGIEPVSFLYIPMTTEQKELRKKMLREAKEKKNQAEKTGDIFTGRRKEKKKKMPSSTLVVANRGARNIYFLDSFTGSPKRTFILKGRPGKMLLAKGNKHIFALDTERKSLLKIPVEIPQKKKQVSDESPVGFENLPTSGEKAPSGEKELSQISEYPLSEKMIPSDMTMDTTNNTIWITSADSNQVVSFDPETEKFSEPIQVNGKPSKIYYNAKSSSFWILNEGTKDVAVIASTGKILKRINLGRKSSSMCFFR
ncbi:MAG: protein kinase [Candidatus Eremiobacteraeota bacterium]|nr:protein kinase [Candidatus Eremiobacteraeota bacterium]